MFPHGVSEIYFFSRTNGFFYDRKRNVERVVGLSDFIVIGLSDFIVFGLSDFMVFSKDKRIMFPYVDPSCEMLMLLEISW